MKTINESTEKKNWGKGTIVCNSMDEFEEIFYKKFHGQMVSPGAAAARLGVSRAYIHQLEKEGKITVYRIPQEFMGWEDLPLHLKVMTSVKDTYIYIADEEIERVRQEMLAKAQAKIKKLKRLKP